MKIKSLLLITLCITSAIQADETWRQRTKKHGLFTVVFGAPYAVNAAVAYLFGKLASGTGYVASKISSSPLIEKYKKQAAIVGGVAVVSSGVVYAGYQWNKKKQIYRMKEHKNGNLTSLQAEIDTRRKRINTLAADNKFLSQTRDVNLDNPEFKDKIIKNIKKNEDQMRAEFSHIKSCHDEINRINS